MMQFQPFAAHHRWSCMIHQSGALTQKVVLVGLHVGLHVCSVMDLERYDVPDDLGPRPKLDPADEILLQVSLVWSCMCCTSQLAVLQCV